MSSTPAAATTGAARRPTSPYVGLVPYGEDDAAFFFGRSHEIAIVSANLRSTRLTIVYGPSGVGKSSLLQAGVVHGLRDEAFDAEHPFAVCSVRSWLDDPVRTVLDASRAALQEHADEPLPATGPTLLASLRAWTERAGTLLVVLDQFEEYFQYHPEDGDGETLRGFAAELADLVNDPSIAVNVLISIREDAWAKLDRFEGHIPLLFANYLRVDHLDLDAAREAIEGPIAAWNAGLPSGEQPYDIEPKLIEAVLTAAAGGLALAGEEETATVETAAGDRVEAPFLQLVLERLWRATAADGERVLTLARLDSLGGPQKIVENHLLEALGRLTGPEQDVASDCFRFLVSRSRTKIAHSGADLAEWTRRPEPQLAAVLDLLCSGESGRILRAVAPGPDGPQGMSYELFHDVLAEPILVWRRAHERERARRAAQRRLVRVGGAALALIAVFAGLSVWALVERSHTQRLNHDLKTFNASLKKQNDRLAAQAAGLKRSIRLVPGAVADRATLARLRKTNGVLTSETAGLRDTRRTLDGQIASLRAGNAKLGTQIKRLNAENSSLAARINRLQRSTVALESSLPGLSDAYDSLVTDAGILRAERSALAARQKALTAENHLLNTRAKELGFAAFAPPHSLVSPTTGVPVPGPVKAKDFGIPAELARTDALRARIAQLQAQLARLLARRARQANEEAFLEQANTLLREQRAALRQENAHLTTVRAGLDAQQRTLERNLSGARNEHALLAPKAARKAAEYRQAKHAVALQRHKNAALQGRNNEDVGTIGDAQSTIAGLRQVNGKLTRFLAKAVDKLTQGAESPATNRALAGLLAVEAFRVTPYGPDGGAHPEAYNALWRALSRLDPAAARALIAPVARPSGKVGTTKSALLRQKICGLVTRGFTKREWRRWLPAGAPYAAKTSKPCR